MKAVTEPVKLIISERDIYNMKEKFMNGLLTLAGKMQSNTVLSAIKDSFIDNMPVVIWGAFCTLSSTSYVKQEV